MKNNLDNLLLKANSRIFSNNSNTSTVDDILEKRNWLLFDERRILYQLKFYYKYFHLKSDETQIKQLFINNIIQRSERTDRNLRKPLNLDHKNSVGPYGKKSFSYNVVLLWNLLPANVQQGDYGENNTFDTCIRKILLSFRNNIYTV